MKGKDPVADAGSGRCDKVSDCTRSWIPGLRMLNKVSNRRSMTFSSCFTCLDENTQELVVFMRFFI